MGPLTVSCESWAFRGRPKSRPPNAKECPSSPTVKIQHLTRKTLASLIIKSSFLRPLQLPHRSSDLVMSSGRTS